MRQVIVRECPECIMEETKEIPVELTTKVYLERLSRLRQRMKDRGFDFVVLYGDREHFANIEYFSRYDCRFEEALFIIGKSGIPVMVVGNEGEAYCRYIPYEVRVLRYRPFSLQGQPREQSPSLEEVFKQSGIMPGMKVGLAGYKYYQNENWFDVPEYIVTTLRCYIGNVNLFHFTKELTGLPEGLRMTLHNVEEIVFINYQASKVANVMRRLFKAMVPGISELQLSKSGGVDFAPQQTYSMVNFGENSISMGIRSPSPLVYLMEGGPMSVAFSQRGALMCRAAFAAKDIDTVRPELRGMLESHLIPYWRAVVAWYESLKVGCDCGKIFDNVDRIIGFPSFGFELNPGHYIGGDEWVNTEFCRESQIRIHNGSHIQCDIIAASSKPVLSAICEDTVVVADESLRMEIESEFPELYEKIRMRQEFMREILGIELHDDVLPMTEMNAVMFPFMLNTKQIFAMK